MKGIFNWLIRILTNAYGKASKYTIQEGRSIRDNYYGNTKSTLTKCTLPSVCGYFTFIGLGTNNKQDDEENKKKSEWSKEKDLSHRITLAGAALKAGKTKKAQFILEQALVKHDNERTVGVICVYDMLATLAYREGKIERAKELLEKVIAYAWTSGVVASQQVVSFKLKLARIQSTLGQTNDAEKNFSECLEMQKFKLDNGVNNEEAVALRINALFWYGKHLIKNKKYAEAKQCFDTAYTLCAKVKTLQNNQVMVILYNLSETSLAIGEVEEAKSHMLNAIILGRMTNSSDLALYYNRLGQIYLRSGLLREAQHWCQNGLDRAKLFHNKKAKDEGQDCLNRIYNALKLGPLKL